MISERGPNNALAAQPRQAASPQSKADLALSLGQARVDAGDPAECAQAADGPQSARQQLQATLTCKKQPSTSTQRSLVEGKGRLTKAIQTNIELYFKRDSAKLRNPKQPLKKQSSPSKPTRPLPGSSTSRPLLSSSLLQTPDGTASFVQPREAQSPPHAQTGRPMPRDGRSVSR